MSTVTALREENAAQAATGSRMVLGPSVANGLAFALSEEFSRRILVSTINEGKTVQEISVEQAIPLSTCYRRAKELTSNGILVIERIVVTGSGKRYAVYRNPFRSVEITSDFGNVRVSVELNEEVAQKFRARSLLAAYPAPNQRVS